MSRTARIARLLGAAAIVLLPRAAAAQAPPAAAQNTCLTCHAAEQDQRLSGPTALFSAQDIHRESGFACMNCHGGDPAAAEKDAAHAASKGFKGAPRGEAQIAACATCHSDAELMHKFNPRQRVDQAIEYATSVHGKRLATGDTGVATCASCHGAHGIRRVNDAKSPVFPTNVAATCGSCHANPSHMAPRTLADGTPFPTGQLADYEKSVHYEALAKNNDLSAPTCNDCHGNHGAAPPGVGDVAKVCGTCHAVFAQKFEASTHAFIFDKGCVECHSNHAVLKPSDAMLSATEPGVCASCHSGADDKGVIGATTMRKAIEDLKGGIDRSGALIAQIGNSGIEISEAELALAEARSKLTLARTELHSADVAKVEAVTQEGATIVASVEAAGQRGLSELQFRRRGLAVSLGAILLLVVALFLKVRQIDARRSSG